ncbi:hypothetical protein H4R20_007304 [Coemansia guatemalensis]|uniref:Uncharacterized protein n=1 Tax=Coemansia guatemalensis TaxID=2761395 RepID=A0A9W8LQB3_9FUNG|nr:hypothetical protein H4R20_007304 [Coemansia guatemalensis]
MFDYPPMNSIRRGAYTGSYGQAASRVRALADLAKKRRHDISIGLQSALSTIYAVELVFYFVRLRHLANRHLAAWRASLMLILLVVDIGLIWLTFRSKKNALSEPAHIATRYEAGTFQGYARHGVGVRAAASSPIPDLPPYHPSHSAMDPHAPRPSAATGHGHAGGNPFASENITRSHLNTPITG